MFISLQELQVRRVRFKVEVPPGEIDYDDKVTQATPLHAEGKAELLSSALAEIRIEGKLDVAMNTPCDRCLETAAVTVDAPFDLVYMPADDRRSGGEAEIDRSAIEVGFYEGSGLRLNDVLREVVLLALPMQVVCSEDCKGICPACGTNRNQGNCGCRSELPDNRWSKLKMLKAEIGPRN